MPNNWSLQVEAHLRQTLMEAKADYEAAKRQIPSDPKAVLAQNRASRRYWRAVFDFTSFVLDGKLRRKNRKRPEAFTVESMSGIQDSRNRSS